MSLLRLKFFFAILVIIGIYADMEFNNVKCVSRNPNFFTFEYCYLRSVNRTYKYFTLKTQIYNFPVTNSLMSFKLIKRDNRNIFQRINGTIDACRYLIYRSNVLAKFVFNAFMEFTNANHTCPYNHDFILDKLPAQHVNKMVKHMIPEGRYIFNVTWSSDNITRGDVIVYFTKTP